MVDQTAGSPSFVPHDRCRRITPLDCIQTIVHIDTKKFNQWHDVIGGRSVHQRGDVAMISPKINTAIRKKGLRRASMERHSDPLRSQLNIMARIRSGIRVCVCRNVFGTSNVGEEVRMQNSLPHPWGGSKNETQPYLLPFGIPSEFLKWSRLA